MNSPPVPDPFAADLEAELGRDAANLTARKDLIEYYYKQIIFSEEPPVGPLHEAWTRHVCWVIENSPASEVARGIGARLQPPIASQEDYEKGKRLLLAKAERHKDDPAVLCNAAFYLLLDRAAAQPILENAYALRPEDPEIAYALSNLYRSQYTSLKGADASASELARKALALGEISLTTSPRLRFYRLDTVAATAWAAGEFEKARAYALELLRTASQYPSDWNYGNAIHHGNIMLGRLALGAGEIEQACSFLLEAGKTAGSPQLNSFGPRMTLAAELLAHGQRDVVLSYLDSCASFWETGQDELKRWRADIGQGQIPVFTRL